MSEICLVLRVMLPTENPDVPFYPITLPLKWPKPQRLLPIMENRTPPKVLLLFSNSIKRLKRLGSYIYIKFLLALSKSFFSPGNWHKLQCANSKPSSVLNRESKRKYFAGLERFPSCLFAQLNIVKCPDRVATIWAQFPLFAERCQL